MNTALMADTTSSLLAAGKGLLAVEESTETCHLLFASCSEHGCATGAM